MNGLIKFFHLKGLRRAFIFFAVNKLYAGTKPKYFERKRRLLNKLEGIYIDEGTKIVGPVEIYGKLTVGKDCWVGKNFAVNGNGTVVIGNNCDIGPEVVFQTGGHLIGSVERRAGEGKNFDQVVGHGTWIGGRSTILNNTAIGESCVIAGGACVVKDVKSNTLVGGVPAKKIRDLNDEN